MHWRIAAILEQLTGVAWRTPRQYKVHLGYKYDDDFPMCVPGPSWKTLKVGCRSWPTTTKVDEVTCKKCKKTELYEFYVDNSIASHGDDVDHRVMDAKYVLGGDFWGGLDYRPWGGSDYRRCWRVIHPLRTKKRMIRRKRWMTEACLFLDFSFGVGCSRCSVTFVRGELKRGEAIARVNCDLCGGEIVVEWKEGLDPWYVVEGWRQVELMERLVERGEMNEGEMALHGIFKGLRRDNGESLADDEAMEIALTVMDIISNDSRFVHCRSAETARESLRDAIYKRLYKVFRNEKGVEPTKVLMNDLLERIMETEMVAGFLKLRRSPGEFFRRHAIWKKKTDVQAK